MHVKELPFNNAREFLVDPFESFSTLLQTIFSMESDLLEHYLVHRRIVIGSWLAHGHEYRGDYAPHDLVWEGEKDPSFCHCLDDEWLIWLIK